MYGLTFRMSLGGLSNKYNSTQRPFWYSSRFTNSANLCYNLNIGELNWQSFTQQKHTVTTEDCHAVLDNGVPHIVIVLRFTVTQLASNLYLSVIH